MKEVKDLKIILKEELKKLNSAHVLIFLICFLITFFVTIQIRTVNKSETDILRLKTENELRDEIEQWKEMYDISIKNISELNKKIEEYRNSYSNNDEKIALVKKDLDNANILAGAVAVKGQGITVTLDDTAEIERITLDAGVYDSNVYVIHDTDIISVINELAAAGAEAFSVNGQRIISTTAIRCVGPLIQINGVNLSAPFTISAIGDSDTLAGALKLRGGIISSIKAARIDVTIEKKELMTIPAYDKVIKYQYAKPIDEVGE